MSQPSVEQAFLHAMLADPDDDAVRLIYADWLEEQGSADRASRIRLECQAARLPDYDPRSFDARAAVGADLDGPRFAHYPMRDRLSVRGLDWCIRDIYYYSEGGLPDSLLEGRAECLWCADNRGKVFPGQLRSFLQMFPSERLPRFAAESWGSDQSLLEEEAAGRLPGLRDLTVLFGSHEPTSGLAGLFAGFPRLESLRLCGPGNRRPLQVAAEDLKRGCPGLRRLSLGRVATDPLPGLADALPRLEVLSLADARVRPSLADLPARLRELYLPGTQLDSGRFPRLDYLERLDLGGCPLGDLSALAEFGRLRVINLSTAGPLPSVGLGFSPPRIDPLTFRLYSGSDFPELPEPTPPATRLDPGPLRGLPELEAIDLRGRLVRVADLLPLPNLRAVRLSGPEIDDAAVERLATACPGLTAVELHGASITDAGVRALAALPLASLRLESCWLINDEGTRALADCPTLREVVLADTALGRAGLEALGKLPRLLRLDVRRCESVSPEDVARFASFPALRSLAFSDREALAAHHLAPLAGVPYLELAMPAPPARADSRRLSSMGAWHPNLSIEW